MPQLHKTLCCCPGEHRRPLGALGQHPALAAVGVAAARMAQGAGSRALLPALVVLIGISKWMKVGERVKGHHSLQYIRVGAAANPAALIGQWCACPACTLEKQRG